VNPDPGFLESSSVSTDLMNPDPIRLVSQQLYLPVPCKKMYKVSGMAGLSNPFKLYLFCCRDPDKKSMVPLPEPVRMDELDY
jgi:hypothetical protein